MDRQPTDDQVAEQWGVSFQRVDTPHVQLRVAVAGSGPLIIMVHGFPECWYSWRHQIKPLADAGYQIALPDVRGYGGSDAPALVEHYSMQALTADMAALAQSLSPDKRSIIVGHDWGAPIAWNSALLFDTHFHAVAGLSVPHVPPAEINAIELFRKLFTDKGMFHYMVYFQTPGAAEAELEADVARSIRLFYTALAADAGASAWPANKSADQLLFDGIPEPTLPRPWLTQDDIDYYTLQFQRSGFRGPLNRYRNFQTDSAFLKAQNKASIRQPSLFIHGDRDMVNHMYPDGPGAAMTPYVSDNHQSATLTDCGHWTQQEKPDEVNRLLLDWLDSIGR